MAYSLWYWYDPHPLHAVLPYLQTARVCCLEEAQDRRASQHGTSVGSLLVRTATLLLHDALSCTGCGTFQQSNRVCMMSCSQQSTPRALALPMMLLKEAVLCRPRLLATAGCWFLWDFSFYGNKVFQSAFIKILSPSGAGQLLIDTPHRQFAECV